MRTFNKRLILLAILFVSSFIGFRALVIPDSFGQYGAYRGDSVAEIMNISMAYADSETCKKCHPNQYNEWSSGVHKTVSCESCKGPGREHIEDFMNVKIEFENSRELCELCHAKNPSRPATHPQKDTTTHNPGQLCTDCHGSHNPFLVYKTAFREAAEGTAEGVFQSKCMECHPTSEKFGVLDRTQDQWKEEVIKMNDQFEIGLTNEQIYIVSTYIMETYGQSSGTKESAGSEEVQ